MFERLQKPFLTVETGEAYQPIRLTYELPDLKKLQDTFNQLKCLEQKGPSLWNWFWRDECEELHFQSLDSYQKNPQHPLRLGSLTVKGSQLYINLPSFKRACLAIPFFAQNLSTEVASIEKADFINKVFGLNERLPHGFTELFNEHELELIVNQRMLEYEQVKERCEQAETAEEAFNILAEYTKTESSKRLPFAERYSFLENSNAKLDPDIIFLGFYIFLRGRELVAIRRWFGETGYTLANAADETLEQVFGGMNIDILDEE